MAKRKLYNFDLDPNRAPAPKRKPKGYPTKVFMKLAKRVHEDAKKRGEKPKWNESQRFASEYLYQEYRDVPVSKINLREVDNVVDRIVNQELRTKKPGEGAPVVPEEQCGSVFEVPIDDISGINWWDLQQILPAIPNNVNIRINAGDSLGYTQIDHSGRIDYFIDIKPIVERIRAAFAGASGPYWDGVPKVRPNYKDDGKNCSYFIDFVLVSGLGIASISGELETVVDENFKPLTKEEAIERSEKKKVSKAELNRRREEEDIKRMEREKLAAAKKRKRPSETPKPPEPTAGGSTDWNKFLESLRKDLDDGLMTPKEYKQARNMIMKKIDKEK